MRVSRLKTIGFEKQKIIHNLVTFERRLMLNDDFQELKIQRILCSQTMLNGIRENDYSSFGYCTKLSRCGPHAFCQVSTY